MSSKNIIFVGGTGLIGNSVLNNLSKKQTKIFALTRNKIPKKPENVEEVFFDFDTLELNNEIDVNAPIQEVWDAFNTPERIAPCLPGAELEEVDGNNFNGLVKIKVGPITAQYKGTASYLEKDEEERRKEEKAW